MGFFLFNQRSIRDPYTQIAWEEALALTMRKFGIKYGIRLWRNLPTLVLGISEKENETIENSYLNEFKFEFRKSYQSKLQSTPCNKKFPNLSSAWIVRRASGGGTVFQNSTSNLNFSLFLDIADKQELYPVQNSYNFLLGVVIQALAMQDITAVSAGKSDLSIKMPNGSLRKISGNAQFRKKDMIVQHGTLILDESLFQEIEKYQLHPPEEPEYRARRTHRDFLAAIESPLDENQFGLDLLNLLSQSKLADLPQEKNSSLTSKNTPNTRQFAFLKESLRLRKTLMLQKYSDNNWLWKTEL